MRDTLNSLRVGTVFAFGFLSIQGQTARPNQEQTEFSAEDPGVQEQTEFSAEDPGVKHPVPLPSEVLAILQRDDLVKNELKFDEKAPPQLPAGRFSASEITLGSSGEKDLIIAAEGPLVGANVNTFWVFVQSEHHYTLALTIPAHDLIVEGARTNGYRNLEAMAATAESVTTVSFRFDGHQYKEYSAKMEDIK
jgi:hypothetical protein